MFYFDVSYFDGGYRRIPGLSSAQCNLRSRRMHLCFDAFPAPRDGRNASSAAQAVPLGDTWRTIRLRMTAECRSGRERSIACSAAIISESRRQSIRMTSNFAPHAASARLESQSQRPINTAAPIPASWAMMKASTPEGAMPAKVSESDRAIVTAGLANDVEAVNQ
jgi:hypothetical protein